MRHRLLESLGPAPLLRRPALATRADLIHRGVELDVEPVGILELDPWVAPRPTPSLIDDRYVPGAEKVADLEQLGDGPDLQSTVVKAGLPFWGRFVRALAGHERDGVGLRPAAATPHAARVASEHLDAH